MSLPNTQAGFDSRPAGPIRRLCVHCLPSSISLAQANRIPLQFFLHLYLTRFVCLGWFPFLRMYRMRFLGYAARKTDCPYSTSRAQAEVLDCNEIVPRGSHGRMRGGERASCVALRPHMSILDAHPIPSPGPSSFASFVGEACPQSTHASTPLPPTRNPAPPAKPDQSHGVHRWWHFAGGGVGKRTPPTSGGWIVCFSANIYVKVSPFVAAIFVGP